MTTTHPDPTPTSLTARLQDTVDRGVTGVEGIHRSIAELPLEVMERNGLLEKTAADVREIQDRSIGAVYDVIRDVNRRIGELASELLDGQDGEAH